MSPTPHRVPARPEARHPAVDGLLRDLGASLQRGSQTLAREGAESGPGRRRLDTGIARIDALLDGGFPAGRLSEITGPASSGRTSLARALLARATRRGEVVAWVDGASAFDAETAASAGAVLERMLWVRPPGLREAARCCECLLDAHGFALVVLDLASAAIPTSPTSRVVAAAPDPALPPAAWQRLARRTAGSGTALLVLSPARATGTFSDLVIEMGPGRARFAASEHADAASAHGGVALLEGLSIEARVVRARCGGPLQRVAGVVLPFAHHAA